MAILSKDNPSKLSGYVEKRVKRGREQMEDQAGIRNLCLEYARGNQYLWLSNDGRLYDAQRGQVDSQGSDTDTHKVRSKRNLILPIVNGKVSAATQRVPGYEVLPSTFDPEDIAGARVGGRVALAGYDLWRIRRSTQKAVYLATVADEGYAMAYWDSNVGPYIEDGGNYVGVGDVRVRTFGANQVMSEPGIDFEESPWFAVQYAFPLDELKKDPDFLGVNLKADAEVHDKGQRKKTDNQVVRLDYYERPCPDYPDGRKLCYANDKLIFPEDRYPLRDKNGPIDEPCLHRLSYIVDPEADHDSGLVRHLIDSQRTYLDANNKALEAKNLGLVTQVLAQVGSMTTDRIDEVPGKIIFYDVLPGGKPPEFRRPIDPQLIAQCHEIADRAKMDMGFISDSNDVPSQVESGKGIQALIEKDAMAWQRFIGDLAEWHSRLMRDCLNLVQQHYTEQRLLKFRGSLGWEPVSESGFKGADLHGQTDVRVLPGSLEPRAKEAIEAKVLEFADRRWVSPEAAMSAINGGIAEGLVDSYEKDVARANLILQKIAQGPEVLFSEPPRPVFPGEDAGWEEEPVYAVDPQSGGPLMNPMTGEPYVLQEGVPATTVPGWMPRPFDGIPVQKAVVEDFLKSPLYDSWADEQKDAVHQYYAALLDLEAKNAARAQAIQTQTAQDLGLANATRPPTKETPDQPIPQT